jgi:hypothetical protein
MLLYKITCEKTKVGRMQNRILPTLLSKLVCLSGPGSSEWENHW